MRLVLTFFVILVLAAGQVGATNKEDLRRARSKASSEGVPILLKIGAKWCVDCASFDRDSAAPGELHSLLNKRVIVFNVDAEEADGVAMAEEYRARWYPSFILTDAEGRTLDRWYGYKGAESFREHFETSMKEPMTVAERQRRFMNAPTAADARKLAELREFEGLFAEAVAYYRKAALLAPETAPECEQRVLGAMIYGAHEKLYPFEDVREQANRVIDRPGAEPVVLIKTALGMARLAHAEGRPDLMRSFVKRAVENTGNNRDPEIEKMRKRLLPDYALHVLNDPDVALTHRLREQMDGWEQDANQLNNIAWWCFENNVHLPKAEAWAREGVERSRPGTERANVLDTLAEIRNLQGHVDEAVHLIRQAIEEAPANEYFQKQLVRFEKEMSDPQ